MILFMIAPKTTLYLGISLTKDVKNLYTKNYRKFIKEIEVDTKTWKNIPCSWMGRTNITIDGTQSNLHIQCNPSQNNTSIHRARTNNLKIRIRTIKDPE